MDIGSVGSSVASSFSSGVSILQNAEQRVKTSASQIANASTQGTSASSTDITKPLIELKVSEQEAQAGAKVIEVEGKRVGTLLNLLA